MVGRIVGSVQYSEGYGDHVHFRGSRGSGDDGASNLENQREIERLKQRDREVRAHEQAHIAAGGQYVRGGPHYEYERGPDGKLYAVGGEVPLDITPVKNNPEATIEKMQVIKRAAMAPAEPSAQDRQIAARAEMEIQKARHDLISKKAENAYGHQYLASESDSTFSVYA